MSGEDVNQPRMDQRLDKQELRQGPKADGGAYRS